MAPKLEIATNASHSLEELAPVVADYFGSTRRPVVACQPLLGGYSGSNYKIELQDGSTFVLKITHGYTAEHAELMCRRTHCLGEAGFHDCCLPIEKKKTKKEQTTDAAKSVNDDESCRNNKTFQFVSLQERHGVPAFMLTFVSGKQADKVMREHPELAKNVMKGIGGGLARMHSAAVMTKEEAKRKGIRWYEQDGGCCDVQDHVNGKVLAKIMDASCADRIRNHPFVPFYQKELEMLQSEMRLLAKNEAVTGVTHGDPFADNILVNSETGDFVAFIDIEDVCIGPLLFDLACCAIGCCFDDAPLEGNLARLDMRLFEALLHGYCEERTLTSFEREHFVPFMKLALLCNCCWRFVKFNIQSIDQDVPEQAKNSYLELQRRIEYLQNPDIEQKIRVVVEKQLMR